MAGPAHFLDEIPYPFSNPLARELRDLLVKVYYKSADTRALAESADIEVNTVDFEQSPFAIWNGLLKAAAAQDRARALVERVLEDKASRKIHPRVKELIGPSPVREPAGSEGKDDGSDNELQIEPIPTLLDIAFLEEGLRVSKGVVRIECELPSGACYGTGLVIGPDLILTNHHVLHDWSREGAPATGVAVDFGFEVDTSGNTRVFERCVGDPDSIAGERRHDWAVVRLVKAPTKVPYTILPLSAARPVEIDDRVYIIQHPFGGCKQIGLHHNDVRMVGDDVMHYRTDTESGSSGAPVFNENWQVVALHHRWVDVGQRSARRVFRNEGVMIARVVEGLRRAGIALQDTKGAP